MRKVVVFDIGGVLVRIRRTWQEAARAARVAIATPEAPALPIWNLAAFADHEEGSVASEAYADQLGQELGCEADDAFLVHANILGEPYPGMPELVRELEELGIVTGCLSNTNRIHWRELTESPRFEWIGRMPMRLASYEVGVQKPSPEIYAAFERRFGLAPEAIVFFDDTAANVLAARERGWGAHEIDPHGDPAAQIRVHLRGEGLIGAGA